MTTAAEIDGVLVQWGERLFYPRSRIVRPASTPRLSGSVGQRAAAIRQRIRATVVRRAPQVMVKVTGGGRGMAAIAARFRYISKSGRLPFEDDRGVTREGKEALHDLAEQWRYGGSSLALQHHMLQPFVAQTGRGGQPCGAGTNHENIFRLHGLNLILNE